MAGTASEFRTLRLMLNYGWGSGGSSRPSTRCRVTLVHLAPQEPGVQFAESGPRVVPRPGEQAPHGLVVVAVRFAVHAQHDIEQPSPAFRVARLAEEIVAQPLAMPGSRDSFRKIDVDASVADMVLPLRRKCDSAKEEWRLW